MTSIKNAYLPYYAAVLRKHPAYKIGKLVGFSLSVWVFFSVLYMVLSFFGKLPQEITYVRVVLFVVELLVFIALVREVRR